jgi:hypothetical protein
MKTQVSVFVAALLGLLVSTGCRTAVPSDILVCREPAAHSAYAAEQARIYRLVEGQAHHLRSLVKPWKNDPSMKLLTDSRSAEHHIRPNTTAVADFAFLYRFGPYDSAVVGCTRQELLANEIIPMLRYLAATHKTGTLKTGDGKAWGDAWQSAHWAYGLGLAAWWSWEGLPADLRASVRQVVAHEADRIAKTPPPYNLRFDSKSEENAWNSQILSIATILMPGDPRRPGWDAALQTWTFSAYCRPADRQPGGANIFDDFTLENHGFVHPDYMGAWIMNSGNAVDYRYTGRKPLPAFTRNLPEIYENQKWFLLPDAGYCYPNGQDWAIFRNGDWMPCHATALAEFQDPEALVQLRRALETAEKMQARHADGAIYAPGENYFPSSQPHLGLWLAQAWLVLHGADRELAPATTEKLGVKYLPDGKLIVRRTATAIHSVAWGTTIMGQAMPIQKDHIVSPDSRNGIGRIIVKGKTLPVTLKSIEVKTAADSFSVTMVVRHGDAVQADLVFASLPDGRFQIDETLTALRDETLDRVETLSFGILNNPDWVYESGKRTLVFAGRPHEFRAAGGGILTANGRCPLTIGELGFDSAKPLTINYTAARKPENSRHTDRLILNWLSLPAAWKKGDRISQNTIFISTTPKEPQK